MPYTTDHCACTTALCTCTTFAPVQPLRLCNRTSVPIQSYLFAYNGKIQPNAPIRHREPVYIGYIQSFGPQKPNKQVSRAISVEKIQHTVRKGAIGAGILPKIQYSRSGSCEVPDGLQNGSVAKLAAKKRTGRITLRVSGGVGDQEGYWTDYMTGRQRGWRQRSVLDGLHDGSAARLEAKKRTGRTT
jgi:hypothetical protein